MNGETIYSLLHDFRIMSLTVKSSFLLYLQEIDIHENINFCFNRLTLSLVIIKALNTTINLNIWILKHLGLPILLFIMNFLLQKENVVLYNHVKFNIKRKSIIQLFKNTTYSNYARVTIFARTWIRTQTKSLH